MSFSVSKETLFCGMDVFSELFDHPIEIWSIDLVNELLASNSNI